jgi:hypothetical protein
MQFPNWSLLTPLRKLERLDSGNQLRLECLNVTPKQHLLCHKVDNVAHAKDVTLSWFNKALFSQHSDAGSVLRSVVGDDVAKPRCEVEMMEYLR